MQEKQIAVIEEGKAPESGGYTDDPTTSFGKVISLYETIRNMKKGKWFRIDNPQWRRRVTAASSYLKIPVTTKKLKDGKLMVKRL